MSSSAPRSNPLPLPGWPGDPFQAMIQFKNGTHPVALALRRIVIRLEEASIPHAVMGGLAILAHGCRRPTDGVDVLIRPEGLEAFRSALVPEHYEPRPSRDRRFVERAHRVPVHFYLTGHYPGYSGPAPITFPHPLAVRERIQGVYYVDLATLVQLKLAAGRPRDLADAVDLTRVNKLQQDYRERIHPDLRVKFIGCLDEIVRDEEFAARNG